MEERMAFIRGWQEQPENMSELCEMFGVSRKTGYKWLLRYQEFGAAGLEERSHAPHSKRFAISQAQAESLLEYRRAHPTLGPKKIRVEWKNAHPALAVAAASTIGELLKRAGLIKERKRRRTAPRRKNLKHIALAPNEIFATDHKGDFRTGDLKRCVPLTMIDVYSRALLCCQGHSSTAYEPTQAALERVFREYGLPRVVRSDNGPPFASVAVGGLSRLAIWMVKLGITPEYIRSGHPEQNGHLERFHRTLKQETCKPPAASLEAQQARFDQFARYYNYQRPHEALGMKPPMSVYRCSPRPYPRRLRDPEYGKEYLVRKVRSNGEVRLEGELIYIGKILEGEVIGLMETANGDWRAYFGPVVLGTIDALDFKLRRDEVGN